MKTVKLFTLGCKVNQYETQAMRELLLNAGLRENAAGAAELFVINTCTVTHQADRQSRRLIRKTLRHHPEAQVIVTGCYVEKDAPQILDISRRIQILPNKQKHRITNLLGFTNNEQRTTNSEMFVPLRISDFQGHERAFVKIQDGCSNFCSFCKVPLVRGSSRSRRLSEIVAEVERLCSNGFKEIVLTGICLGDYRYQEIDLADTLASLQKLKGDFRLRLSSIEPQYLSDKLIAVLNSPKVCAHLHIPLQSGDDAILKKMRRRYSRQEYLSLIRKIKKKIKDLAITTDVLVGFPGETELNLRNTVRCLQEILPLRTHIFSFSRRPATAAFELAGGIAPPVLKERVNIIREAAAECSYKFRRRFLGRRLSVLVESQPDRESGKLCGYSENYIRVIIEDAGRKDINNLVQVKVKAIDKNFTKAWI